MFDVVHRKPVCLLLATCFVILARPTRGAESLAKLVPPDVQANDTFGLSVSQSGDRTLIWSASGSGSAYVYRRTSTGLWNQEVKLTTTPSLVTPSVSLSGDLAILGGAGVAHAFRRGGLAWTDEQTLTPSVGGASATVVAVDGDAALVLLGGAAYVFRHTQGTWAEEASLTPAGGAILAGFSACLRGGFAILPAVTDDHAGSNAGAAFVFARVAGTWTEQAKLVASDARAYDHFGQSVAIDGNYAMVGATPRHPDDTTRIGRIYIFERQGTAWTEVAHLTASDGQAGDEFGGSLALNGDNAIVGAPAVASAYLFRRSGGNWTEDSVLRPSDWFIDSAFGASVALGDTYAVVGAPWDGPSGSLHGAAYLYCITPDRCIPTLSSWAVAHMSLLLVIAASITLGRRFSPLVHRLGGRQG